MPPLPVTTSALCDSAPAMSSASMATQSSRSSALALPCASRRRVTAPDVVRSIIGSLQAVLRAELRQPAVLLHLAQAGVDAVEELLPVLDVRALLRHGEEVVAAL